MVTLVTRLDCLRETRGKSDIGDSNDRCACPPVCSALGLAISIVSEEKDEDKKFRGVGDDSFQSKGGAYL